MYYEDEELIRKKLWKGILFALLFMVVFYIAFIAVSCSVQYMRSSNTEINNSKTKSN